MTYQKPISSSLRATKTPTEASSAYEQRRALEELLLPSVSTLEGWVREFFQSTTLHGVEGAVGGPLVELLGDDGPSNDLLEGLEAELRHLVANAQPSREQVAHEARIARERILHEWLDLLDLAWRYRRRPTWTVLNHATLLPESGEVLLDGGDADWATICSESDEQLLSLVSLSQAHLAAAKRHLSDQLFACVPLKLSSHLGIRLVNDQLALYDPSARVRSLADWLKMRQSPAIGMPIDQVTDAVAEDDPDAREVDGSLLVLVHPRAKVLFSPARKELAIDLPDLSVVSPPVIQTSGGSITSEADTARNRYVFKSMGDDVIEDQALTLILSYASTQTRIQLFAAAVDHESS